MSALRRIGLMMESELDTSVVQSDLSEMAWDQFKVQLIAQEDEQDRETAGGLPVRIVGHAKMSQKKFGEWALEMLGSAYGEAYARRTAESGIDVKEMGPAGMIGRKWQRFASHEEAMATGAVRGLVVTLEMMEKYPALYNLLVREMRGKEPVTVKEFMEKVFVLPNPLETGAGKFATLGDLIAKNVNMLPAY
jgi:hypothetical protein